MQFEYVISEDKQWCKVVWRDSFTQNYLAKVTFTHTRRPFEVFVTDEVKGDVINFIEAVFPRKNVMSFKSDIGAGMFRINQTFNTQEVEQVINFINTLEGR